ncbi:MAG: glycosyltransferase, partial [Bacteroidales bacterium]|nr:glycosyltransferase [Bacteroidales bacterium]
MTDKTKPLVSIIIPTKNNVVELAECLETIAKSAFEEIEIIIVDGGSTDDTIEMLDRYSKIISNYISEPDSGVYDALNKGCMLASGRFYLFLGADDRLLNNLKDISLQLKDPNTIYYGDVILQDSNYRYDGKFSVWKLARTNICHQAIFYPETVFKSYRYNLNYPIQADWELNMRLWHDPRFVFKYIDFPITVFGNKGLSSTKEDKTFNNCYLELIKIYFPRDVYVYRKI